MLGLDVLVHRPSLHPAFYAIALTALAGLGYFALLAPKALERDTLSRRLASLEADLAAARLAETRMRPFRAEAAALRERLEVARARMPADREIPALYRQIGTLATESGLSVALFAPRPSEEREVYREVEISMAAEGSYHQFGRFFEGLGRLPRIVSTSSLRLAGIERPTGTVRAELVLTTYVLPLPESTAEGACTPLSDLSSGRCAGRTGARPRQDGPGAGRSSDRSPADPGLHRVGQAERTSPAPPADGAR